LGIVKFVLIGRQRLRSGLLHVLLLLDFLQLGALLGSLLCIACIALTIPTLLGSMLGRVDGGVCKWCMTVLVVIVGKTLNYFRGMLAQSSTPG
jgi:uncharacterized RDD family membrane protein YckC